MIEAQGHLIIITIAAMTAVTYFSRAGGLLIVSRINPSPRVRAFLHHMPASILVAIIIPTLVGRGPAEILSACITALVAVTTRNLIVSMLSGLVAVSFLRKFIFV